MSSGGPQRPGRLVVSFDDTPAEQAVPEALTPTSPQSEDDVLVELRRPEPQPPRPTTRRAAPLPPVGGRTATDEVVYASWLSRVGASVVDGIIVTVLIMVALFVFTFIGFGIGSAEGFIALFFIYWVVALIPQLAYAPVLMARVGERNGQTLGKQVAEIRVVRDDGEPMSFWYGVLRDIVVRAFIFGGLGLFLFGIPTLLDIFWPFVDERRRCLHDIVCKTAVVRVV